MDDQDDGPKNDLIYQRNPTHYVKQPFKPKSWTETVVGYINEANELSQCILRNRKLMGRDYAWFVTINVEAVLTPEEITALWTKAKRKMEARGVVAIWVREPSRSNHCNYHMIVKEGMSQADLEQAIEDSLPPRQEIAHHKQVAPVKDQFGVSYYITKGKVRGEVDGRGVPDRYDDKRLLFKPSLRLRKYGTIGEFWVKPRKQLWEEIKALEKKIAEGLGRAGMPSLVRHFQEMFGEAVPLRKIERSLGANADSQSVQDWLDQFHEEGEFPDGWESGSGERQELRRAGPSWSATEAPLSVGPHLDPAMHEFGGPHERKGAEQRRQHGHVHDGPRHEDQHPQHEVCGDGQDFPERPRTDPGRSRLVGDRPPIVEQELVLHGGDDQSGAVTHERRSEPP